MQHTQELCFIYAQMLIFVLYAITMLSIYGGKLPTIIINKTGKNPYACLLYTSHRHRFLKEYQSDDTDKQKIKENHVHF